MTLHDPQHSAPGAPGSANPQELQALDLAFLGSLLPGIVHNFATPLSGVLGATQLLEKRSATIEELVQEHERLGEAERGELLKQFDRNRTNVEILSRNAKHLADLLQVIVQRISRGSNQNRDFHTLNDLLQCELRFLEAHLAFKHKVRKQVTLSPRAGSVRLVYGHVAQAFEEFVISTLSVHNLGQNILEMEFQTEDNDQRATLSVVAKVAATAEPQPEPLGTYLARLRDEGWETELRSESGLRCLRLTLARTEKPA